MATTISGFSESRSFCTEVLTPRATLATDTSSRQNSSTSSSWRTICSDSSLVGTRISARVPAYDGDERGVRTLAIRIFWITGRPYASCLLYTSDAADE